MHQILPPPLALSRTFTQSLRPDASEELETALRTAAKAHQYLRAEMLLDPEEASMSGVSPETVNQIAHDRMELLQRVIPALAKQTTSASVNEVG